MNGLMVLWSGMSRVWMHIKSEWCVGCFEVCVFDGEMEGVFV